MSINQSQNNLFSVSEFADFLFKGVVPLEEVVDWKGEPFTTILPFWRKHSLVPFLPDGKWARISFAQLFWLHILDTLRQFRYPAKKMKILADYFFKDAYDAHLPKRNIKYNIETLKKKKAILKKLEPEEQTLLDDLEETLTDDVKMYMYKWVINYLTELIMNSLNQKVEAAILIFADDTIGERLGDDYFSHKKKNIDPQVPHISISMSHFLKEFIDHRELGELLVPQLLNEKEKAVLRELKRRNLSELLITLHDGNIKKITATKHGVFSDKQAKEIGQLFGLKKYESVTVKPIDDHTYSFKKSTVKKMI